MCVVLRVNFIVARGLVYLVVKHMMVELIKVKYTYSVFVLKKNVERKLNLWVKCDRNLHIG